MLVYVVVVHGTKRTWVEVFDTRTLAEEYAAQFAQPTNVFQREVKYDSGVKSVR